MISNVEVLLEPQQREAYVRVWQSAFGTKARQLGLLDPAQNSADSVLTAQASSLAQRGSRTRRACLPPVACWFFVRRFITETVLISMR